VLTARFNGSQCTFDADDCYILARNSHLEIAKPGQQYTARVRRHGQVTVSVGTDARRQQLPTEHAVYVYTDELAIERRQKRGMQATR